MSNAPGSSSSQQLPQDQAIFTLKTVPTSFSVPLSRTSVPNGSASPTSPVATISKTTSADATLPSPSTPSTRSKKPDKTFGTRLAVDEAEHAARVSANIEQCLLSHHLSTLIPDTEAPFQSTEDVVDRLLPYHVFQQPKDDSGKGKRKATEEDLLREEIADTRQALEFHRRQRALEKRFRRARIKSGKRTALDDQAFFLAQAVLEGDKAETTALAAELRAARAELDKIEREKRQATASRSSYYSSAMSSSPLYTHHYRYHYPYAQQTGSLTQTPISSEAAIAAYNQSRLNASTAASPTTNYTPTSYSTTTQAPSATTSPTTPAVPPATSIPVQLPIASLPALHALGIMPVPASSVPPPSSGQLPPAAVLREASPDGRFLTLDINVPALQPSQMSGLAVVLNSLARGTNGSVVSAPNTTSTTAPQTSYGGYQYPLQYTAQQTQPNSGYSSFPVSQNGAATSGGSSPSKGS